MPWTPQPKRALQKRGASPLGFFTPAGEAPVVTTNSQFTQDLDLSDELVSQPTPQDGPVNESNTSNPEGEDDQSSHLQHTVGLHGALIRRLRTDLEVLKEDMQACKGKLDVAEVKQSMAAWKKRAKQADSPSSEALVDRTLSEGSHPGSHTSPDSELHHQAPDLSVIEQRILNMERNLEQHTELPHDLVLRIGRFEHELHQLAQQQHAPGSGVPKALDHSDMEDQVLNMERNAEQLAAALPNALEPNALEQRIEWLETDLQQLSLKTWVLSSLEERFQRLEKHLEQQATGLGGLPLDLDQRMGMFENELHHLAQRCDQSSGAQEEVSENDKVEQQNLELIRHLEERVGKFEGEVHKLTRNHITPRGGAQKAPDMGDIQQRMAIMDMLEQRFSRFEGDLSNLAERVTLRSAEEAPDMSGIEQRIAEIERNLEQQMAELPRNLDQRMGKFQKELNELARQKTPSGVAQKEAPDLGNIELRIAAMERNLMDQHIAGLPHDLEQRIGKFERELQLLTQQMGISLPSQQKPAADDLGIVKEQVASIEQDLGQHIAGVHKDVEHRIGELERELNQVAMKLNSLETAAQKDAAIAPSGNALGPPVFGLSRQRREGGAPASPPPAAHGHPEETTSAVGANTATMPNNSGAFGRVRRREGNSPNSPREHAEDTASFGAGNAAAGPSNSGAFGLVRRREGNSPSSPREHAEEMNSLGPHAEAARSTLAACRHRGHAGAGSNPQTRHNEYLEERAEQVDSSPPPQSRSIHDQASSTAESAARPKSSSPFSRSRRRREGAPSAPPSDATSPDRSTLSPGILKDVDGSPCGEAVESHSRRRGGSAVASPAAERAIPGQATPPPFADADEDDDINSAEGDTPRKVFGRAMPGQLASDRIDEEFLTPREFPTENIDERNEGFSKHVASFDSDASDIWSTASPKKKKTKKSPRSGREKHKKRDGSSRKDQLAITEFRSGSDSADSKISDGPSVMTMLDGSLLRPRFRCSTVYEEVPSSTTTASSILAKELSSPTDTANTPHPTKLSLASQMSGSQRNANQEGTANSYARTPPGTQCLLEDDEVEFLSDRENQILKLHTNDASSPGSVSALKNSAPSKLNDTAYAGEHFAVEHEVPPIRHLVKLVVKPGHPEEEKLSALAEIQFALSQGASPHDWVGPGSPLKAAIRAKRLDLIHMLLEADADPIQADDKGVTLLHLSTYMGSADISHALLEARADPRAEDRYRQTPLFFTGSVEAGMVLLEFRANVNVVNGRGQTALHLAGRSGHKDVLLWLAEQMRPAMLRRADVYGASAGYYARQAGIPLHHVMKAKLIPPS